MGGLVERLRADIDEEVNEPLDRLLAEVAENEAFKRASRC
jgi:hypothetical protein